MRDRVYAVRARVRVCRVTWGGCDWDCVSCARAVFPHGHAHPDPPYSIRSYERAYPLSDESSYRIESRV